MLIRTTTVTGQGVPQVDTSVRGADFRGHQRGLSWPPVTTSDGQNRGLSHGHGQLIWAVADFLRGDYRQSEYAKVILPLTVLRHFDCVLKPTKDAALAKYEQLKGNVDHIDPVMESVNKEQFFNTEVPQGKWTPNNPTHGSDGKMTPWELPEGSHPRVQDRGRSSRHRHR